MLRTARLSSAYLIDDCVNGLAALEQTAGAFLRFPPVAGELEQMVDEASNWLHELSSLRPHVDVVAKVIGDAAAWTASSGPARAFADTLASSLIHVAADELNLSPGAFRRLVEPFADGWRILLFDDNEGGSGNCRRLWDVMRGWVDIAAKLQLAMNCPVAKADAAIAEVLGSGHSPESLSLLKNDGKLAEFVHFDGDAASRLRLNRTLENADIAAFNLYAFSELSELRHHYGGVPPLRRFMRQVANTFALDPRAEALRRHFTETHAGGISELPSRLRAVMPLCEGACAYCLGNLNDEDYSDRRLLATL